MDSFYTNDIIRILTNRNLDLNLYDEVSFFFVNEMLECVIFRSLMMRVENGVRDS